MNNEKKFLYRKIKNQTAGFLKEEEAEILRKAGFSDEIINLLITHEIYPIVIKDLLVVAKESIENGILIYRDKKNYLCSQLRLLQAIVDKKKKNKKEN